MTTSSDNRSPSPTRTKGAHWDELRRSLPESVRECRELSTWLDASLAVLEETHADFTTKRSRLKSLQR